MLKLLSVNRLNSKGETKMLLEADPAVSANTAPITANVTYIAGSCTILVPVFALDDPTPTVFAPPFVITGEDVWTIIFTIQTAEQTFENVIFKDLPVDLPQPNGKVLMGLELPTWQAQVDTRGIKNPVEVLHCTITLNGPKGARYTGDPSIAVVQDPMGG